jgi:hypothetical protein
MYAHVTDGVVDTVGGLPIAGWTGTEWVDLKLADGEAMRQAGWFTVEQSVQPPSTAQSVYVPSYVFASGKVTELWTPRPKTAEEIKADTEATNRKAIEDSLDAAIAGLRVIRDDTNANINQNAAARIKDMAKIMLSLVRLDRGKFDGTN